MNAGSIQDYRAAIALNNMGVSLLERACYRQAMETLQDGIHVMKEVFRPDRSAAGSSSEVDFKLHQAAQRVASPVRMCTPWLNVSLQTLSFDLSLSPVLNYLRESPSTTCFLPIRIDLPPECGFGDFRLHEPDFESAIILYNFGVANLLLSKVASGTVSEKLRGNAMSILNLASSVLSKRSSLCDDTLEEASLLQLGLMVFHTIIQVLVDAGDDLEASIVYERYDRLRDAVEALHESEWYADVEKVAAPAA